MGSTKKRKYEKATRVYYIPVNDYIIKTLNIFKLYRPDLKKNQDLMDYAYELFERDFENGEIFAFDYRSLELIDKDFTKRVVYRILFAEHRLIKYKIMDTNKKFKCDVNKAEYFRRIILWMFLKYGLYIPNKRQPLILEAPENLEDLLFELDEDIRLEIEKSWFYENEVVTKEEEIDDKTLEEENEDDKTIDVENIDYEILNTFDDDFENW